MPRTPSTPDADAAGVTEPIDLVIGIEYYGDTLPRKFNYCAHERDREFPSYQSSTREGVTVLATRMIQAHRINNLLDTKAKVIAWKAFNERWNIDPTAKPKRYCRHGPS